MVHTVLTGQLLVEILERGAAELERHKAAINALNVFPVPDGDTGTNMALTLGAAIAQMGGTNGGSWTLSGAARQISRGVLLGARGNSGVILSQFLRGFAEGVAGKTTADPRELAHALEQATAFAYRAVIKPVEGTMLSVGKGASTSARAAADAGADLADVLAAATKGAERALARTPEQLPVLKRAGVVDAGGKGLVCFLQGAVDACRGVLQRVPGAEASQIDDADKAEPSLLAGDIGDALADLHLDLDPSEIAFRYCTEFLIRGSDLSIATIRSGLEDLGDSLLVVGDEEVVKVHIHTEHPGRILEIGVSAGELLGISIDNMREQQQQQVASLSRDRTNGVPSTEAERDPVRIEAMVGADHAGGTTSALGPPDAPDKAIGVVAVVQGEGWEQLLSSLGVDRIVRGGQTMNPSAAELLQAIEQVPASAVIVLPNNSNVVFAARQAQQLSGREVHVVETTSPPEGVAAMLVFHPLDAASDMAQTMAAAARRVRTAEIGYAIRDSEGWGKGIKAGDKLGIVDGDIKVVAQDVEQAALETLTLLLDESTSFVSVYYGDEVDDRDAEHLAASVRSRWPGCEIELFHGGQPVYFYFLSVE